MQNIEAVVFDFGGVFIGSPFPTFMDASQEHGIDPDLLIALTFGPFERDSDHPWHRVERGQLSMIDARKEIIALCEEAGLEVDPFVLLARGMGHQTEAKQPVVDCVRKLRRRGIKTGLLTNNALEIRERWRAVLPLDELFDDVVDSSEVGIRKPDLAIYRLALERLGDVPAHSAIFLDDIEANVDAARETGMHGIIVEEDPSPALTQLHALLSS